MKKLILIPAIALSGLIFNSANAQIRIHIGFGFHPQRVVCAAAPGGTQQPPVYDRSDPAYTDTADDYYYLPDVDAYYDVTDQCYVYFDGDNWISAAYLPGEYHDYDWRNCRKFEVRASRPYMHDDFYRSKYSGQRVADWSRANYNNHFNGSYANQGYKMDDRRNDGTGSGYNQPVQQTRFYNQPAQQSRNTVQRFYNRADSQQSKPNNNRMSDQRGGTGHFAQSPPQNNGTDHRMSKF